MEHFQVKCLDTGEHMAVEDAIHDVDTTEKAVQKIKQQFKPANTMFIRQLIRLARVSNPYLTGYIHMCDLDRSPRRWVLRYAVLHHNFMFTFEHHQDPLLRSVIILDNCALRLSYLETQRHFSFILETGVGDFGIALEDLAPMQRWMRALKQSSFTFLRDKMDTERQARERLEVQVSQLGANSGSQMQRRSDSFSNNKQHT
eukprot:GILK01004918.1.p1 GENE.GILK01004918.1~~GILK01004918.1.p1  ORF type:complete len:214 (-),score=34.36 GILK01004918.1:140-742(-)